MELFSMFIALISIVAGGAIGFFAHYFLVRKSDKSVIPQNIENEEHGIDTVKNDRSDAHKSVISTRSLKNPDDSSVDNDAEYKPEKKKINVVYDDPICCDTFAEDDTKTMDGQNNIGELDSDRMNTTLGKLHGKLATAQLKAKTRQIAEEMSEEEKTYEQKMKDSQLESILNLMLQNQEKFGMNSDDIKEQMSLYNF